MGSLAKEYRNNLKSLSHASEFVISQMENNSLYQSVHVEINGDEDKGVKITFWDNNCGGSFYYGETRNKDVFWFNKGKVEQKRSEIGTNSYKTITNKEGVLKNCRNLRHVVKILETLADDEKDMWNTKIVIGSAMDCVSIEYYDDSTHINMRYYPDNYVEYEGNNYSYDDRWSRTGKYPKTPVSFIKKIWNWIVNNWAQASCFVLIPIFLLVGVVSCESISDRVEKERNEMVHPTDHYRVGEHHSRGYAIIQKYHYNTIWHSPHWEKSGIDCSDLKDFMNEIAINDDLAQRFATLLENTNGKKYRVVKERGENKLQVLDSGWDTISRCGSNIDKFFVNKRYDKEAAKQIASLLNEVNK